MMDLKITYDNTASGGFTGDWGFSCFIEYNGKKILFDSGAKPDLLLENMFKLKINPQELDLLFISHDHWDHVGGIQALQELKPDLKVFVPGSYNAAGENLVRVNEAIKLGEGMYSTGELSGIEQALLFETDRGVVVVAGCSHPGVGEILKKAGEIGKVHALIGGLHGFSEYDLLKDISVICPTHCTQHIDEIKELYPEKYVPGGVGTLIRV